MDKFKNNIKEICNNHYKYLLNLSNVNGVGYGFKYVNNVNTFKPCINVFVKNKILKNYISHNNLIPKNYMGITTDVIQIGQPKLKSGGTISQKIRPLQSGCNISSYKGDGTLGCIVTRPYYYFFKEYFILSNNHVLADLNNTPIGFPILQPGFDIGGNDSNNIVARLSSFVPLKVITKYNSNNPPYNYVDCAIAKVVNGYLVSNKIYKLGEIKGIGKISLGEKVKKVGCVSGLTEGHIKSMHATIVLEVDKTRDICFKELILSSLESELGDSGSVVVNNSNEILGLFIGGTDDTSCMNDINLVLSQLNVSLYTG